MIKRMSVGLLLALLTLLFGCSNNGTEQAATSAQNKPAEAPVVNQKPPEPPAWDNRISDRARLVERLPQDVLLYLRLPNIWGLLNAPKNGSLHGALSSEANQKSTRRLQQGASDLAETEFAPYAELINLLASQLRSPLEVAVVTEQQGDPLTARMVLGGRFAYQSIDAFNQVLQQWLALYPSAQLVKPGDGQSPGQIMAGPAMLRYTYDAVSGQLLMAAGLGLTDAQFEVIRSWPVTTGIHPIQAAETRLDASRTGMLLWANMERAAPILKPLVPPPLAQTLQDLGIFSTSELALGFGSSQGRGRMMITASGSQGVVWELTPPAVEMPAFKTAGVPELLLGMRIPDYTWVTSLLTQVAQQQGKQPEALIEKINIDLIKAAGIDLKTFIGGLAGSHFMVFDRNGTYMIHQGVDEVADQAFMKAVEDKFKVTQEALEMRGGVVNHMTIPPIMSSTQRMSEDGEKIPPEAQALLKLVDRINTHLYWVQEGDVRIYAEVPQVLMDRQQYKPDTQLADWLAASALDFSHSLLYLVGNIHDVPRTNYYAYLRTLNALADLFGQPVDLSEFPSARALGLPEQGVFSLQLDYAQQRLGLGISYESHPAEIFYGAGGAMGAVAAVGVLAAVAIPAYQDYLWRAEIARALILSEPLQAQLESYVAEHGQWPNAELATQFQIPVTGDKTQAIYFDEETGGIVLEFSLQGGAVIVLLPEVSEGRLTGWQCFPGEGLPQRYLPKRCK